MFNAIPLIKARFDECRRAFERIQTTRPHRGDLPCDLSCDVSLGECGGSDSLENACDCLSACDWPFDTRGYSKRAKRIFWATFTTVLAVLAYAFYGRDINSIYLTDQGFEQQGWVNRLVQRNQPRVRVLVIHGDQEFYSSIADLDVTSDETSLSFERPIPSFDIERIEIHDARLEIGHETLVVGQVIEAFDQPASEGRGQRFRYRFKRRWHF